jgi:hypothetical protein
MNSVFRLAARCTSLCGLPPEPEVAPLSEKRYLLSCVRFAGKGRERPWSLRVRSDQCRGPGGVRCVRFVHMKRNVINFAVMQDGITKKRRIISRVLESQRRPKPPLFFKLFGIFPILRRIPARLIGIGIRPEHVRIPEAAPL